jgi:AAA15 family ATPase/GTPase
MYISGVTIRNFRLFSADKPFTIEGFNIPDEINPGAGINIFVGENGCGKTTVLDAIALPLLEYKSESFSVDDINDPQKPVLISVMSEKEFSVRGTMPKVSFCANGFTFKASIRARNAQNYLSSVIVSDQLFIPSDPDKPADGSPDLRVGVNNPFSGKRFSENDIIFLDKNRCHQTRAGSFNQTRFDRLMEDFDFQYIKGSDTISDVNSVFADEIKKVHVSNNFLIDALNTFRDITDITINLDFVDNYRPFKNAAFVQRKDNHQQIKLGSMGSGYEMIFSLVYSYFMAQQSKKKLIVIIDEPELHMHPALQAKLLDFILKISRDAQVFMSTHSSLLIKQLSAFNNVKIMILRQQESPLAMAKRKLPYLSANETNFLAFSLATAEYHNDLYEYLKSLHGDRISYKEFDKIFFVTKMGEKASSPWMGNPDAVSIHTFIRNQIHHSGDNGNPEPSELRASIEKMRTFID